MLSKPSVNLVSWNPQFFREIKGRLKLRNVAIAISASLICQFLAIMIFFVQLPVKSGPDVVIYNRYCLKTGKYCTDINWSYWSLDIFITFSWILFLLILLGGVYMLVADFAKEERLGTLNFIRLSPQHSHNILLGKLLGVPILIYLAAAIGLPLHLWAIISSNLSLYWFFEFYGILIIVCCFFYNASLLFVFLGGTQAWLAATIAGIFLLPFMAGGQGYIYAVAKGMSGIKEAQIIIGVMILGLVLGSYWIWQAVNRRYRNPNATVISKKQSYWLVGTSQIYLLLFFLQYIGTKSIYNLRESIFVLCTINFCWFLLVIALLSPQRQTLQDWARYRHQQVNNDQTAIVKGLALSLKQDLIWGEKSPALVAIAINLVMTVAIWIGWILLWGNNEIKLSSILTLIMSLNLILIYAAIAQLILLMKVKKPVIWATAILSGLIVLPPVALLLASITPDKFPNLWLFSTFPWISLPYKFAPTTPMLIAIIAQWSVSILVTLQLTRKIRKLGESNSQKLLTAQNN